MSPPRKSFLSPQTVRWLDENMKCDHGELEYDCGQCIDFDAKAAQIASYRRYEQEQHEERVRRRQESQKPKTQSSSSYDPLVQGGQSSGDQHQQGYRSEVEKQGDRRGGEESSHHRGHAEVGGPLCSLPKSNITAILILFCHAKGRGTLTIDRDLDPTPRL